MPKKKQTLQSLTPEQVALVSDNLGLVGVHLRRNVANLHHLRRDREWEDLFQEGCLGLIAAAATYDPAQGIPFASYALPRIHNAVSTALHERFTLIRTPLPRRGTKNRHSIERPDTRGDRVHSLYDLDRHARDRLESRHDPSARFNDRDPQDLDLDAVGERIVATYACAVNDALRELAGTRSSRGDRNKLMKLLADERWMIPEPSERRTLRQVARDTASSFARVVKADNDLASRIRAHLRENPDFREPRRRRRTHPDGPC